MGIDEAGVDDMLDIGFEDGIHYRGVLTNPLGIVSAASAYKVQDARSLESRR